MIPTNGVDQESRLTSTASALQPDDAVGTRSLEGLNGSVPLPSASAGSWRL